MHENNAARQSMPSLPKMGVPLCAMQEEPTLGSSRSGMATCHLSDPFEVSSAKQ